MNERFSDNVKYDEYFDSFEKLWNDSNAIAQLINTVAPKEIVYVHGET